jgi:hypothetical protein
VSADLLTRPAAEPLRLLLAPREAAAALSISERTLWEMTAPRGPIRCLRLSGRGRARSIRYPVDALRAWIESQTGDADGRGDDPAAGLTQTG